MPVTNDSRRAIGRRDLIYKVQLATWTCGNNPEALFGLTDGSYAPAIVVRAGWLDAAGFWLCFRHHQEDFVDKGSQKCKGICAGTQLAEPVASGALLRRN